MKKLRLRAINNESGFVAIVTATLVIIIVSVIVISFTVITRRETIQARDRQLSTQAFYAAESGANYAVKKDIIDSKVCDSGQPDGGVNGTLDSLKAITVPCLLVNNQPQELIFDDVNRERPLVFNLKNPVSELTFSWQSTDSTSTPSAKFRKFPKATDWDSNMGVVEVLIYPLKFPQNTDPNNLGSAARTYYLYPGQDSTGGSTTYSSDGEVVKGSCSAAPTTKCLVKITGLDTGSPSEYVIRLRTIYKSAKVQVTGPSGVALTGVQRVIDSTGKATDVLHRVQIRVPIRASYNLPIYAVETAEDLCKLLTTDPTGTNNPCT